MTSLKAATISLTPDHAAFLQSALHQQKMQRYTGTKFAGVVMTSAPFSRGGSLVFKVLVGFLMKSFVVSMSSSVLVNCCYTVRGPRDALRNLSSGIFRLRSGRQLRLTVSDLPTFPVINFT